MLNGMRRNLRRLTPQLLKEGWSKEDIGEISAVVREHLAANNDEGLVAMAKWLGDRAWPLLVREMAAWDREREAEFRVVPVARDLKFETARLDREWARAKGRM